MKKPTRIYIHASKYSNSKVSKFPKDNSITDKIKKNHFKCFPIITKNKKKTKSHQNKK